MNSHVARTGKQISLQPIVKTCIYFFYICCFVVTKVRFSPGVSVPTFSLNIKSLKEVLIYYGEKNYHALLAGEGEWVKQVWLP